MLRYIAGNSLLLISGAKTREMGLLKVSTSITGLAVRSFKKCMTSCYCYVEACQYISLKTQLKSPKRIVLQSILRIRNRPQEMLISRLVCKDCFPYSLREQLALRS